jgi:flavorubredoxin
MKALVVYESMFGNTQKVAQAIAEGLSTGMQVDVQEVGVAPDRIGDQIGLLVVGAPTHAFGLSRESTRRQAAEQADGSLISRGRGVREWIGGMKKPNKKLAVATFDTRMAMPSWLKIAPTAGPSIEKRLRKLGLKAAKPSESFVVGDTTGPLETGELERARGWGRLLASQVSSAGRA